MVRLWKSMKMLLRRFGQNNKLKIFFKKVNHIIYVDNVIHKGIAYEFVRKLAFINN